MKIFSDKMLAPNGTVVFALYVDSELTGDPDRDVVYSAIDIACLGNNDPNQMLSHLIPMLNEILYTLYGEKPEPYGRKEPLTNYKDTKFDPRYPNGVNTGIYDK
jgi:hypothetical protein